MSSTVTKKASSRKRKPQAGRRSGVQRKQTKNNVRKSSAPAAGSAEGFAGWIGLGAGVDRDVLPAWKDLSTEKNKRGATKKNVRKQVDSLLEQVTTGQFAMLLMAVALGLGLYVSHVFATQDTLSHLQEQRHANLRLELQYNQLKGQLDKKISPSVIYHRARELGLQEGLAFGPTVQWKLERE